MKFMKVEGMLPTNNKLGPRFFSNTSSDYLRDLVADRYSASVTILLFRNFLIDLYRNPCTLNFGIKSAQMILHDCSGVHNVLGKAVFLPYKRRPNESPLTSSTVSATRSYQDVSPCCSPLSGLRFYRLWSTGWHSDG